MRPVERWVTPAGEVREVFLRVHIRRNLRGVYFGRSWRSKKRWGFAATFRRWVERVGAVNELAIKKEAENAHD